MKQSLWAPTKSRFLDQDTLMLPAIPQLFSYANIDTCSNGMSKELSSRCLKTFTIGYVYACMFAEAFQLFSRTVYWAYTCPDPVR